jgi:hypothetical protein
MRRPIVEVLIPSRRAARLKVPSAAAAVSYSRSRSFMPPIRPPIPSDRDQASPAVPMTSDPSRPPPLSRRLILSPSLFIKMSARRLPAAVEQEFLCLVLQLPAI